MHKTFMGVIENEGYSPTVIKYAQATSFTAVNWRACGLGAVEIREKYPI